jgi:hypothetical protein
VRKGRGGGGGYGGGIPASIPGGCHLFELHVALISLRKEIEVSFYLKNVFNDDCTIV